MLQHHRCEQDSIGILGVGNLLLGDEGFGVHCIRYMEEHFSPGTNVQIMDGGTAGIMTASFIERHQYLFIIDTVALDEEPGTIHLFAGDAIHGADLQSSMSPHQIGLIEVLELCRMTGQAPEHLEFLTIVPETLAAGIGLSPCLQEKVDDMIDLLQKRLSLLPEGAGKNALRRKRDRDTCACYQNMMDS